jgi:hypothetical protein
LCELEWVLAQTGDPKLAMDFIGDTDLRVMQRYLKRRDDRLIALAAQLDTPERCHRSATRAGAGKGGPRKASSGAEKTEPPVGFEPTTARFGRPAP